MKVLQICSKPPLPEIDGGCKAMNSITQGMLNLGVEVKILTLSTQKHPFNSNQLASDYLNSTQIETTYVDTTPNPISAALNLLSSKSYNLERFNVKEFDNKIAAELTKNSYDVVLLEGLYVSMYLDTIRGFSSAKVIYRAHNIESEIWHRNVAESKGLKRWYLNQLAKKLEIKEKLVLNNFDGIAAISEKDKKKLVEIGCNVPVDVFPFGVDLEKYQSVALTNKNSIFHIGSMEWLPNQHGVNWFIDKVWSVLSKKYENLQFYLAGKNMPQKLKNAANGNLFVLGEVDDAIDFINHNSIMIVPIFAGSGMRIKIIEGMALKKTVIATSIAAEGINCSSGVNIIIADTAKEFIEAIEQCLADNQYTTSIGEAAKKLVASSYDNKVIVNNLVEFFKQLN